MKLNLILSVCVLLFSLTGCTKNSSSVNNSEHPASVASSSVSTAEAPESQKILCNVYVFADRQLTKIRVKFIRGQRSQPFASEIGNPKVYFNDIELTILSEDQEIIEFGGETNGFTSQTKIALDIKNKRYEYTMRLEPIDFASHEPFTFHRLQSNSIPLSRPYTEENELWISIFDNYVGAFKEIAEFDESKTSIVIPQTVSERMSVGDSRIQLHNVGFLSQKVKELPVEIFMTVDYRSEIPLKVIR